MSGWGSAAAADDAPALSVEGVCKRFGEVVALDGVSLEADREILGLVGANGAGKSTLYRSILDLAAADEGTIRVDGFEVSGQSVEARRRIGYLPEELHLYDRLSGWELLELVAGLKELDNAPERREWLAFFDLDDRRDVLLGEYSLGMRKKIGLIAALMGAPRLALLDEPLNGLDTESMRRLRLRIEEMKAAGTTFVVSSHVMSFVERICDRVAILKRGRLVATGTPDEVRRQANMADEPFEDVFLELALD
ncbi:MAG: ABC transporter ATP-binding protein [bacterium]|nr:ABC transporter ATP-binding protein [bacterium]